jgi:hypothetical protein
LINGEVGRREYHEDRIGAIDKGGSSLHDVEGIAWCSGLYSSGMIVGRQHR